MVKKGDTLIEVLLAVGIFSMIAISVVAVMSGGTSSAQTALETTLAREEIDAQAEALRYIHDSYINDKNSENTELPTVALWRTITSNAYNLFDVNEEDTEAILQYTPTSCPTNASELPDGAFILDTRALDLPDAAAYKPLKSSDENSVFAPAATFPRLIFGVDTGELTGSDSSALLSSAEGIYIIAVADKDTTTVLDIDGQPVATSSPAFYDFYIRTCWYGTDADTPSTISTVIRLHNPDVQTQYYSYSHIIYDEKGNIMGQDGSRYQPVSLDNRTQDVTQPGWDFLGWCDIKITVGQSCPSDNFHESGKFYNTNSDKNHYELYPVWRQIQYTIKYDSNGSSWSRDDQVCTVDWEKQTNDCYIAADDIKRSGYEFKGWCDGNVDITTGSCSGTKYSKGQNIKVPLPNNTTTLRLKAIWKENNRIITIRASWTSNTDYDSYLELTYPGTDSYVGASWSTTNINVTYHDQTYSLVTGLGDGRGGLNSDKRYYENFVINTLGGKNYYYSIRRFSGYVGSTYTSGGDVGNDVTVTVTIQDPENGTSQNHTYYSKDRKCTGNYWNVFGYRDGEIINRNTCSASSMEYDYK